MKIDFPIKYFEKAIELFEYELNKLNEIADIKTICAYGSPLSKWDSERLWGRYDFRQYGILGEPYLSINFDEVFYLKDTGRKGNGENVTIRDKVTSQFINNYKSTFDIIEAAEKNDLPEKLLINTRPHRWSDKLLPWVIELLLQNIKNIGKKVLIKINK